MKQARKRVILDRIERKIYKLERRIIKMSTARYELEDLAKKLRLELDQKEKVNASRTSEQPKPN